MKKLMAMVVVVLTMCMCSVGVFAYNGDPTGYDYNYGYNYNYNYNYNNRYSGLRPNTSTSVKRVPDWLEDVADEYGAEFYVNPNSPVSRLDVFFSIARMLESKFERDGITFSTSNYAMFSDLGHLDYSCIPLAAGLYNRGILRGYTDGTAKLPQSITRAEFTAVVNRLAHLTGKISYGYANYGYSRFNDISGHWAEQVINETVAVGMMNGVGYNQFDPEGLVTYAQMFKVLTTFVDDDFGLQEYDVAYGCTNTWDVDFDVEEEDTSNGKAKITSLTATKSTIYAEVGETVTTKVKINPSDATNKTLSWEAKSERIVFIEDYYTKSNYGYVVVECNKVGETYIVGSATDGSKKSVKIKVVVTDGDDDDDDTVYVSNIKVNPTEVELEVGESQTITATVTPSNATNKGIVWESHNTDVATVNQNGKITAVGVGNTTVTATAKDGSGVLATIDVTVTAEDIVAVPDDTTAPVVELTGADNVSIGQKVTLTVKVNEENLENFEITETDLLGLTGGASINKIKKVSDDTYEITLMGVEVSSLGLCIDAGVAVDAAGNVSAESNEVIIFINSGEDL